MLGKISAEVFSFSLLLNLCIMCIRRGRPRTRAFFRYQMFICKKTLNEAGMGNFEDYCEETATFATFSTIMIRKLKISSGTFFSLTSVYLAILVLTIAAATLVDVRLSRRPGGAGRRG